jgi:hypothetical protein
MISYRRNLFTKPLPRNGRLFWFYYPHFQQTWHNIKYTLWSKSRVYKSWGRLCIFAAVLLRVNIHYFIIYWPRVALRRYNMQLRLNRSWIESRDDLVEGFFKGVLWTLNILRGPHNRIFGKAHTLSIHEPNMLRIEPLRVCTLFLSELLMLTL